MSTLAYHQQYFPVTNQWWGEFGDIYYGRTGYYKGGFLSDIHRSADAPPYPHTEDMIAIANVPFYLTVFGAAPRNSPLHHGETVWLEPYDSAKGRFSTTFK